jgi:hypothetical protein
MNHVPWQLSGSDRWDCGTNPKKTMLHNLFHEWIPSIFAGRGTPFMITYAFTITIDIQV